MILLTGATGFVGKKLAKRLIDCGYELISIKRKHTSCEALGAYAQKIHWISENELEKAFSEFTIDIIIHCATQYGRNKKACVDLVSANIELPIKLVELGNEHACKLFINTDSFFTKNIQNRLSSDIYMENYSLSKFFVDEIMRRNSNQYTFPVVSLKLEHVYGPQDGAGKFVDYILKSMIKGADTLCLSSGEQIRDWVFLDDVVEAYMCIVDNLQKHIPGKYYKYEVGTGVGTSVRGFVELAKEVTASKTNLQFGAREMQVGELDFSVANNQKLVELGWQPKYRLVDGIAECVKELKTS